MVRKKNRYTDEELLDYLQELADQLGKAPTRKQCDEAPKTASSATYMNHFGSWNTAIRKAGITPRSRGYSDEELIDDLQGLTDQLGEIPTKKQCNEASETASSATYVNHFGSWSTAIETADLSQPAWTDPSVQPTEEGQLDDELIEHLRRLRAVLGRRPTISECDQHPHMSHSNTYRDHFGSWKNALREAGIDPSESNKGISMVRTDIRELVDIFEGVPTESQMDEIAPFELETYKILFGSWENAVEAVMESEETAASEY